VPRPKGIDAQEHVVDPSDGISSTNEDRVVEKNIILLAYCVNGRENSMPKIKGKRASACPPSRTRSLVYGPWSLEWLTNHNHGDVGVVSYSRRLGKKKV
jgi:hypothetical protein